MIQVKPPVNAQERNRNQIRWRKLSVLPPAGDSPGAAGYAGMLAGLHQDKLIVAGGANFPDSMPWFGGKKKYYNRIYIFSQKRGKLSMVSENGILPEPIAYAASCSTPRGVFYGGGESERGILAECGLIGWNSRTKKNEWLSLPSLPLPLANAMAVCYGEKVFLAGGESAKGVSDKMYLLDLAATEKGWQEGPTLLQPVSHGRIFALPEKGGCRLFIAGGRCRGAAGISTIYTQLAELSWPFGKWISGIPMPYALAAGTGVMISNGCLLLLGGDKGTVFNQVEKLLADISSEKNPDEKERLNQEKIRIQSAHPGFSRQLLLYCPGEKTWKKAGNLPFETPVTTEALIWNNYIVIPSGEIRAGVRSPYFLVGKLPASLQ